MNFTPKLLKDRRACCACGVTASCGKRIPVPGEPNIVAISLVIYRRGVGKGQLSAAPRVQICQDCLVKALAGSLFGAGREGSRLWGALRESISFRYSSMVEADEMEADNPAVWAALRQSLPFPDRKSEGSC
jgi:hypothetical protein